MASLREALGLERWALLLAALWVPLLAGLRGRLLAH